ncbi:MAG: endopeptidase La, partial [Deltaproteobacteria bacterium RIFOXYA12_FULL_61_11]
MAKKKIEEQIPDRLPVLPIRDVVIFPYMIVPLFVGRSSSINAVDEAIEHERFIFLSTQRDSQDENPLPKGVYRLGCIGIIMKQHKLPDGRIKILIQGVAKAKVKRFFKQREINYAEVQRIEEPTIDKPDLQTEAMMRSTRELIERVVAFGKSFSQDVLLILDEITDPGRLADLVISNLGLKLDQTQKLLEVIDPVPRLAKVFELLKKEHGLLEMQEKIKDAAKEEMTKTQREYFLREQLRAIKTELGDIDGKFEESEELRGKISPELMPPEVEAESTKQLRRLENMQGDSAEASLVRTYLEWLTNLPWRTSTEDNLDISHAHKVLDEDHYDLEKIKERILDYLAVCTLRKSMKGPILCFVGPPGVGKTSLGQSIARAMNRKFIRMSLGGMRDEAEIRGHRRTYVGALPGRIIQGIKQAGSNNPVFMLDELDKIGQDFRGDPAAALLEVLDPEQNHSFTDHYLNLPFDLSKVMFIATANITDPIPSALRDRVELITIPGYSEEEKISIAKRYLIPRQIEENGLAGRTVGFSHAALIAVIRNYTKEAGLRNLNRELATVLRKLARRIAENKRAPNTVTPASITTYLGPPTYLGDDAMERDEIGIATGLAWTQYGGEILQVEASTMEGKGGRLTLTGHLGEVMKESAIAALTYVKTHRLDFG